MSPSVAVLGTGTVGLSTALRLQEVAPNFQLTVIGEKYGKDTTSYGAAGNFFPEYLPNLSKDELRLHRWYQASFDRYNKLLFSNEAYNAGITLMPFIIFFDRTPKEEKLISDYSMNFRPFSENMWTKMKLPDSYSKGYIFDSFLLESRYYMPYLRNQIIARNGEIEHRYIESVEELAQEFDIILNCTGLGSKMLFNDHKVYPVRGQMLRVHAPWIKHAYMGPDYAYIFPCRESVVLGGCAQPNNYSVDIDPEDRQSILDKTQRIVPSLRHATVLEEWTGLRPCRDELRLEIDTKSCSIPVVHNYGHGSKGVSLSYGTAVEAVELAKLALRQSKL